MKSTGNRPYKFSLLAIMAALLVVGSFVQPVLTKARDTLGLTQIAALENAPPMLAFTTVALGGFRGIIANALWLRANDLQEEGKYFEAMQLADWITKLQPRMTQVWTVQAWNMVYNISVKFPESDRWRWIKAGVELLRDEGLKYNPDNALIYRELAWFFQHKMGHYLDAAHMIYKTEWAREMMSVLGRDQPDWEALINPQTEDQIARSRRLREVYKMDPVLMKEIDDEYGPLEWKLPESSAIYWAMLGLKYSSEANRDTLMRVIYQSMDLAFKRGRLTVIGEPGKEEFIPGPNLAIVDKTNQAYLDMIAMDGQELEYSAGYRNFLRTVVYNMYLHGRTTDAQAWWKKLKEIYPQAVREGLSIDDYVVEMVTEDVSGTDIRKTTSVLEGQYTQAYSALALGETEQAEIYLALASKIWLRYMRAVGCFDEPPDPDCNRVRLPPREFFRDNILIAMLDPDTGLTPEFRAQLLTALNLPADFDPRANLVKDPDQPAAEEAPKADQ